MKIYPGTSYWDAYLLPIPVRKWLIEEHVRQMEKQEVDQRQQSNNRFQRPPSNIPLTPSEKKTYQSAAPAVKK